MNKSDSIIVHSTSEGKLYINEKEFFNNNKVKEMVKKLINSSVYQDIKFNRKGIGKK